MATQRTLKLNLLADVDKFGKGLDKAGKDAQGFSGKVSKYGKIAAKSLAAVGAAAAVMAVKLGVDAVKGAVEDEASQKKLATALRNTTKATDEQIASTEDYITKTQLRYGVSDVKLRASLGNLVRATGDVTEAQNLNNLALDISISTGKDLETVSLALGKASLGNLGALTKLGVPLDANIIKTKDFEAATDELQKLFGGAALANTETLAGKVAILKETFGEVSEDIGVKLIPKLKLLLDNVKEVAAAFSGDDPEGLTTRARELQGVSGDTSTGSLGRSIKILATSFSTLFKAFSDDGNETTDGMQELANALLNVATAINAIASAYSSAKSALDFIDRSGGFGTFGGFKGLPNPFTGNALGGTVRAGVPTRVGEMGSEVFIPSTGGQIIPNNKLGGGGNTFIFNGVIDAASARRSIERVLQTQSRVSGAINLAGAMS
jgi:hypothetical protein